MPQADTRDTVSVQISDFAVVLRYPTDGQIAALRRIMRLIDSQDPAAVATACTLFLDIADTLVTDTAILNRLYEGMAMETIKLEEYAEGLLEALRHFLPSSGSAAAAKGTRRPARAGAARGR